MSVVDSSRWPLVLVTYPKEVTDAFVESLAQDLVAIAKGDRSFAVLVDATSAAPLTAKQRAKIVSATDDNHAAFAMRCVGQAIVVRSALSRGVLTAMSWLKPPPMPMRTFDSTTLAEEWLRSLLADK